MRAILKYIFKKFLSAVSRLNALSTILGTRYSRNPSQKFQDGTKSQLSNNEKTWVTYLLKPNYGIIDILDLFPQAERIFKRFRCLNIAESRLPRSACHPDSVNFVQIINFLWKTVFAMRDGHRGVFSVTLKHSYSHTWTRAFGRFEICILWIDILQTRTTSLRNLKRESRTRWVINLPNWGIKLKSPGVDCLSALKLFYFPPN